MMGLRPREAETELVEAEVEPTRRLSATAGFFLATLTVLVAEKSEEVLGSKNFRSLMSLALK